MAWCPPHRLNCIVDRITHPYKAFLSDTPRVSTKKLTSAADTSKCKPQRVQHSASESASWWFCLSDWLVQHYFHTFHSTGQPFRRNTRCIIQKSFVWMFYTIYNAIQAMRWAPRHAPASENVNLCQFRARCPRWACMDGRASVINSMRPVSRRR